MKFINPLSGVVGIRNSADDVMPEQGVVVSDLVESLVKRYNFSVRPDPAQTSQHLFQMGRLIRGDKTYAIQQLQMMADGDFVLAQSTDVAEVVMEDYVTFLDGELGFKLRDNIRNYAYISTVVFELDEPLEKLFPMSGIVENLLAQKVIGKKGPFSTKRLYFGFGPISAPLQALASMNTIEQVDFTIERRVNEPLELNRYFSAAPLKTQDHIKLLEELEAALKSAR